MIILHSPFFIDEYLSFASDWTAQCIYHKKALFWKVGDAFMFSVLKKSHLK